MISLTPFLVVAVLICGTNGQNGENRTPNIGPTRIVGGSNAKAGEFPFQVSLQNQGTHFCGGSIMAPFYVLTAGHCTDKQSEKDKTVLAGTNQLNKGGQRIGVTKFINHASYNGQTYINDIALVKLVNALTFGNNIKPIKLGTEVVGAGKSLTTMGWGYTTSPRVHRATVPNDLQKLNVKSISVEDCQKAHKNYGPWGAAVNKNQVCTFTGDKVMRIHQGACKGDSGGPLIDPAQQVLIGVTSWGLPCAKGVPDVFTRVSSYGVWINEQMKKNSM